MTASNASAEPVALGFLTVCDVESLGLVGGYLLLNASGRPLEFHCTAPLRPSRAQEILYGPTLEPFLYGEQIGRALVEKTSLAPLVIVTNRSAVLAVAPFVSAPVAVLAGSETLGPAFRRFEIGTNRLAALAARRVEMEALVERITAMGEFIDLAEPFERIREAIGEAHRDAKQKAA